MKFTFPEKLETPTFKDIQDAIRQGKMAAVPASWAVIITPDVAQQILERYNSRNRKLQKRYVSQYAKDMAAGRWNISDPVMFNRDGILENGQHRLAACCAANVSFVTFVAFGTGANMNLDRPNARTIADFGKMDRGNQYETNATAALRNILRFSTGKFERDDDRILNMYDSLRVKIEELNEVVSRTQCNIGLNASSRGAMFVMAAHGFKADEIADMMTVWRTAAFDTEQKRFLRKLRDDSVARKGDFDPKRTQEGAHRTAALMREYVRYFYPYLKSQRTEPSTARVSRLSRENADKLIKEAYDIITSGTAKAAGM